MFIVTGSTGLLGALVAGRLLRAGSTVLTIDRGDARQGRGARARAAVRSALVGDGCDEGTAESLVQSEQLLPVETDWGAWRPLEEALTKTLAGRTVEGVIHCAAAMGYSRSTIYSAYRQNVSMTLELYGYARRITEAQRRSGASACRFHYVSTAYSGGFARDAGHVFDETLHERVDEFPSVYHLTKNAAEKDLFIASRADDALPVTVHRPCGIIGHSRTGWLGNHSIGVCHGIQLFAVARHLGIDAFTVDLSPDNGMAMIPVDFVAGWILDIAGAEGRDRSRHFDIVHLTSARNVPTRQTMEALARGFDVECRLGRPEGLADKAFNDLAQLGRLYTNHSWRFERARLHDLLGVEPGREYFDLGDTLARSSVWWRTHRYPGFVASLRFRERMKLRLIAMLDAMVPRRRRLQGALGARRSMHPGDVA